MGKIGNIPKHSVTKGPYFSKKSIIIRFSKVKSFTINWSRVFKIEEYHFLLHFSKHSICTKVVLSSLNLTDIDQNTKIDHFSIVFFVFNKALVPFVQIWAARKIILWILGCDEQILKKSLQGLPRWPSETLFKKMHLLKTYPYFHFLCLLLLMKFFALFCIVEYWFKIEHWKE